MKATLTFSTRKAARRAFRTIAEKLDRRVWHATDFVEGVNGRTYITRQQVSAHDISHVVEVYGVDVEDLLTPKQRAAATFE